MANDEPCYCEPSNTLRSDCGLLITTAFTHRLYAVISLLKHIGHDFYPHTQDRFSTSCARIKMAPCSGKTLAFYGLAAMCLHLGTKNKEVM